MIVKESIYKNYIPSAVMPKHEGNLCYWLVFSSNKLLINEADKHCIPCSESLEALSIQPIRTLYLGSLYNRPCYCAEVSEMSCVSVNTMVFYELRSLYGRLSEDIFLLAGRARQLITWDQTHQFCGQCGTHVFKLENEMAKKCPKCGLVAYPRISPAVITAIFKGDQILLAHADAYPGNMYSLIAGFVEAGETLEECVKREIMEEVSIVVRNIQYFGSQSWPFPHSLMVGFTAEYESGEIRVDGVEIADAKWFKIHALPNLPSHFSIARLMIDHFVEQHRASNLA